METLLITYHTQVSAAAGSIKKAIRENNSLEILAQDAAAVNQTVKAITMARMSLKEEGMDISFTAAVADGKTRVDEATAFKFVVTTLRV